MPGRSADAEATPAAGGVTPGAMPTGLIWDTTPKLAGLATLSPRRQRSRWDETPASMGSATPLPGAAATPAAAFTPGVTPPIALGVSGGPDSTTLCVLMAGWKSDGLGILFLLSNVGSWRSRSPLRRNSSS